MHMRSSSLSWLSCLLLLLFSPMNGSTIECTDSAPCQNTTLQCDHGENCQISCIGRDACSDTILLCPWLHNATDQPECHVLCSGTNACSSSSILNATNAVCHEKSCPSSTIEFNQYHAKDTLSMSCVGNNACLSTSISHTTEVQCKGANACTDSQITCHANRNCAMVNDAGNLEGMTFKCPFHSDYNCTIYCGSNCGQSIFKNVQTFSGRAPESKFVCRTNGDTCDIHCEYCQKSTIHGKNGDLIVSTPTARAGVGELKRVTFYCPSFAYCNISCISRSDMACDLTNFYSQNGTKLFIEGGPGLMPLNGAIIRCPDDSTDCDIYGWSGATEMLYDATIYATNRFNLHCETSCFADQTARRPTFYCDVTNGDFCILIPSPSSPTNWACLSDADTYNAICDDLLTRTPNPSQSPTNTPTTAMPSFSPTFPFDEDKIIYLSTNGCDYGICDSAFGNYNQYCSRDDFMSEYAAHYNHCCSAYNESLPELSITVPTECDAFGIVTIDGSLDTYQHSLAANTFFDVLILQGDKDRDDENYPSKALCFAVAHDYSCHDPVIEIFFEDIWYAHGQKLRWDVYDEYLTVSYMDPNAYISDYCWGGTTNGAFSGPSGTSCGDWLQCDILPEDQPTDTPWTYHDGIKVFYFKNGPGVFMFCKDGAPKYWPGAFNMNVSMSVTCSSPYLGHSTCNSMHYES